MRTPPEEGHVMGNALRQVAIEGPDALEQQAADVYRMLTGQEPADAVIADDGAFDSHILASILAVASVEQGLVAERVGLAAHELARLIEHWFPRARDVIASWCRRSEAAEDDETAMVRDLLLAQCSIEGDTGRWLAAMVARRAVEPNHLWEDLGLRDRGELSRLLTRYFAPLAARNTKNMRWKRFFYRMLCEDDGFVMCSTPVCSQCGDFDLCFGDESGESRMAYRRRVLALKVVSLPESGESAPIPTIS
jgi:nitrogen fixation protein NifQ